jgi:hypothetical protein
LRSAKEKQLTLMLQADVGGVNAGAGEDTTDSAGTG